MTDSNRIRSRADRIDTHDAVDPHLPGYKVEHGIERGVIERQPYKDVTGGFEAIEIDDRGDVAFWTTDYVFHLFRTDADSERTLAICRHPDSLVRHQFKYNTRALLTNDWSYLAIYHNEPYGAIWAANLRVPGLTLPLTWRRQRDSFDAFPWIIQRYDIEQSDDRFEALAVTDLGHFTIWTERRVFGIFCNHLTENLYSLPRNVPTEHRPAIPIHRLA